MADFDSLFKNAVERANKSYESHFKFIERMDTVITHSGHTPLSLPDMGNPIIPPITLSTTFQQVEAATGKVRVFFVNEFCSSMNILVLVTIRDTPWKHALPN